MLSAVERFRGYELIYFVIHSIYQNTINAISSRHVRPGADDGEIVFFIIGEWAGMGEQEVDEHG